MPEIVLEKIGSLGVIKDLPELLLPPGAMTDALNVRFDNGRITSLPGDTAHHFMEPIVEIGKPSIYPRAGSYWPRPTAPAIYIAGSDGHIYGGRPAPYYFDGDFYPHASGFEFYKATEEALSGDEFHFGLFGGGYAIFVNDGASTPQYALYDEEEDNQLFQEIPGWNYAGGQTVAACLVTFGYSLVAGNLTYTPEDNSTPVRLPVTVRVSAQAAPGAFPHTWEPGLETDTADEFELNAKTPIVGMATLRSNLMVYCQDSIHVLSNSNGVLSVATFARDRGILNQRCVLEFEGKHLCVTRDDIYLNAGTGQFESILEGRMRDFYQQDVDTEFLDLIFPYHNERAKEIVICYRSLRRADPPHDPSPEEIRASDGCNMGLVWNYRENNLTFRSLVIARAPLYAPFVTGNSVEGEHYFVDGTQAVYLLGHPFAMEEVDGADGRLPFQEETATIRRPKGRMGQYGSGYGVYFVSYVSRERLMFGQTPSQAALIQNVQVVQDIAQEYLPWQQLLFASTDTYFHGEQAGRAVFEEGLVAISDSPTVAEAYQERSKRLSLEPKTNFRPNQGGRFISYCISCVPRNRPMNPEDPEDNWEYDPADLKQIKSAPLSICMISLEVKGEIKR